MLKQRKRQIAQAEHAPLTGDAAFITTSHTFNTSQHLQHPEDWPLANSNTHKQIWICHKHQIVWVPSQPMSSVLLGLQWPNRSEPSHLLHVLKTKQHLQLCDSITSACKPCSPCKLVHDSGTILGQVNRFCFHFRLAATIFWHFQGACATVTYSAALQLDLLLQGQASQSTQAAPPMKYCTGELQHSHPTPCPMGFPQGDPWPSDAALPSSATAGEKLPPAPEADLGTRVQPKPRGPGPFFLPRWVAVKEAHILQIPIGWQAGAHPCAAPSSHWLELVNGGEKKRREGGSAPGSSAKKLTCKPWPRPHFCGRSPHPPRLPPCLPRHGAAGGTGREGPTLRKATGAPSPRAAFPSPPPLSPPHVAGSAPRCQRDGEREARRPQGARAAAATNGSRSRQPGTNRRPPAHGHYPRRRRRHHHARAACAPAAALLPSLPPSRGRYGGSPRSLPRPFPDLGMVRRSPDPLLWCGSCGAGCCRANHTSSSFSVPSKKCAPFSFMVRQLGNQQPQKLTATPPPPPAPAPSRAGFTFWGCCGFFFFFQY